MGKASKALRQFIEDIPVAKLTGISKGAGTIYTDTNFRLDMQGMTTGNPQRHNLQVQVNRQTSISTLKNLPRGETVATYLANTTDSAEVIRAGLLAGMHKI